MASGFAFGFTGEDIDVDLQGSEDIDMRDDAHSVGTQGGRGVAFTGERPADVGSAVADHAGKRTGVVTGTPAGSGGEAVNDIRTRSLNVGGMLATLPSRISYTTTIIISPLRERKALIPRRALFDVRMQIMAEDDNTESSSPTTTARTNSTSATNSRVIGRSSSTSKRHVDAELESGLGASDIETNVYEGGFKSWEGAMDLARLLLERGPRKDIDDLARVDGVVELGCGTALPTLILFQHALANDLALGFTLADYNASVLRLVTLPNLLLVWALQHAPEAFDTAPPRLCSSSSEHSPSTVENEDGDLNITPELLSSFTTSLAHAGITLTLIAGPWSPLTTRLTPLAPSMSLLILAAETIYSPSSLSSFTDTLLAFLKSVRLGKALVAAKRVYFGVGGSVDGFKLAVARGGGVASEVENSGVEGCDRAMGVGGRGGAGMGVGRALLEVQMC